MGGDGLVRLATGVECVEWLLDGSAGGIRCGQMALDVFIGRFNACSMRVNDIGLFIGAFIAWVHWAMAMGAGFDVDDNLV